MWLDSAQFSAISGRGRKGVSYHKAMERKKRGDDRLVRGKKSRMITFIGRTSEGKNPRRTQSCSTENGSSQKGAGLPNTSERRGEGVSASMLYSKKRKDPLGENEPVAELGRP